MIKKWFTGKDVMERWKINNLDLIELILEDLPAYDSQNDVKISTQPDSFGGYDLFFENKAAYIEGRHLKEGRFVLPYSGNISVLRRNLKTNIDKIFFQIQDIEEFEKKHPGLISKEEPKVQSEESQGEEEEEVKLVRVDEVYKIPQNYFLLKGDYWDIGFMEEKTSVRNTKGMMYIARLLDNQDKDVNLHTLTGEIDYRPEENEARYEKMDIDELKAEGMEVGHGQRTDRFSKWDVGKANEIFLESERDLEDKLQRGTLLEKEEAQEKHDKMKKYLQGIALGSITEDSTDKERKRILKNVKTAIERIRKNRAHRLSQHLSKYIHIGRLCSYRPNEDDSTDWYIKY